MRIEEKWANRPTKEVMDYYYTCQVASASESQGTTKIAEALLNARVAIDNDIFVEQTGGFTMLVYVYSQDHKSAIGLNAECIYIYNDLETDEGEEIAEREEGMSEQDWLTHCVGVVALNAHLLKC